MSPLELVTAIAASVVGVGAAGGMLLRGERRARRIVTSLIGDGERLGALERINTVAAQVAAIDAQMHPNSGHSLRDSVDGLDALLRDVSTRQDRTHDMLVQHIAGPHPRR